MQRGRVVSAKSKGDMFRGFENILIGRNPVDANMITQRICGVCPISHAIASSKCLESAFGIKPDRNGVLIRNLILAANYLQSHILHFYHLAALDFVDIKAILQYQGNDTKLNKIKAWALKELDSKASGSNAITAVSPFLPRYEGKDFYIKDTNTNIQAIHNYIKALEIRMKTHKMVTLLGGKVPHAASIVPGGVTQKVDKNTIKEFKKLLIEVKKFVSQVYLPDVIAVANSFPDYYKIGKFNNFMSYGAFEDNGNGSDLFKKGFLKNKRVRIFKSNDITEHLRYSRFAAPSKLHPSKGNTKPNPYKGNAYSWVKAPRYQNNSVEVGPLARVLVNYFSGDALIKGEVDSLLNQIGKKANALNSVLGRHAARAIECKVLCDESFKWLQQIDLNAGSRSSYEIPENGQGMGLTEAPRGALGHWITIDNYIIDRYQCVVPTTWNASPKDDAGRFGAIEQALLRTPISDLKNPIEAARVVRSFDPCLACAIHITDGNSELKKFRVC